MKAKAFLVALLSLTAITLYWSPVPLQVGDYILGGYPWIAPEESRTAMMILGGVFTAIFLGLTVLIFYISSKLEELSENPESEHTPESISW